MLSTLLIISFRNNKHLLNQMSTDNYIEHWKETECYRDLLANKYFRQVKQTCET